MGFPLVSIVIPAYNRPHTLQIAIDSVLEQTYPNIEIIICDDSTDDRVQEMLVPYLASSPQIKYHKNERNLFLENWHKCFDLASGDYINYLMDDDVFHKEKIAKMIYFFNEFENIALVTSYRQTIDESGQFLPPIWATVKLYQETRILDGKELANFVLTRCINFIGEPTTVLFRKKDLTELFGVYKGKQYSLINDLATWLSLLSKGKAVYIPDTLSYFRLHPDQNSNKMDLIKKGSEWLDIIIASREDGFLDTDDLFKTALHCYRNHVKKNHQYVEDIKRIDKILITLDQNPLI
ncbi:glycosyltransferase family 2 protein [Paenibacillus agricola]|uniref:Glycosyltransferase family 2 protein n=1 Tax=Paenibacillus agricola TaxID=2716264 RepID=A0ABX0J320_9BACL|nr:glycosyltransferase family 2 protein [Paenibacillus agricola]NHN29800.1 glycosyltransferase family 2 protein [Paenibacillus agricola]